MSSRRINLPDIPLRIVRVDGITITGEGTSRSPLVASAGAQVQSDWSQTNNTQVDYIKNKPTIPSITGLESTSNKVSSWSSPTTNTNYPTEKLVKDSIAALESIAFVPTTMTVNTGSLDAGVVGDLAAIGGTDVAISEGSGADPLRVTFTFTGVTRLSEFVFYGYYAGGAGHQIVVEAYNVGTTAWDQIGIIGADTVKRWYGLTLYSPTSYISSGSVQIRLRHVQTGIISHDLYLDYVELNYGGSSGVSNVTASSVVFTPSGSLAATNVASALIELDTEKEVAGTTSTHAALTTGVHGAGANTFVYSNDSRLTDARTPTAHNQEETTITFTDVTTGNVSTSAHGYFPKLPTATGKYLRDDLTWQTVSGTGDVVGDDTTTVSGNIVAYNSVNGKNITELTGTQGDILYHNGTSWQKLGAGTDGYFLRTSGASANPKWSPCTVYNQSTSNQGAGFATDTYVTGSNVLFPSSSIKVGTRYYCMLRVSKTNVGTATPILNIRFGTNASTSDTSRGTLTWTAGTAAADDGIIEIWATFSAVGASGTLRTVGRITHKLSVTGLTGTAAVSESEVADSGTFDTTVSNSYIGISLNAGSSAAWTVHMVQSQIENLA